MKFTMSVFLVLGFVSNVFAWSARIVAVSDGDTVTVESETGSERIRIRLYGIDAPEKRQPNGESARRFVFRFLYQVVEIEPQGKKPDRYGRTIGIVYLPDGKSLQAALLRAGLAWVWPWYCRECGEWEALQEEARIAGRGLWADPKPIPPWEWRRK